MSSVSQTSASTSHKPLQEHEAHNSSSESSHSLVPLFNGAINPPDDEDKGHFVSLSNLARHFTEAVSSGSIKKIKELSPFFMFVPDSLSIVAEYGTPEIADILISKTRYDCKSLFLAKQQATEKDSLALVEKLNMEIFKKIEKGYFEDLVDVLMLSSIEDRKIFTECIKKHGFLEQIIPDPLASTIYDTIKTGNINVLVKGQLFEGDTSDLRLDEVLTTCLSIAEAKKRRDIQLFLCILKKTPLSSQPKDLLLEAINDVLKHHSESILQELLRRGIVDLIPSEDRLMLFEELFKQRHKWFELLSAYKFWDFSTLSKETKERCVMEKNIPVIKILEDNNLLQDIQCHLLVQPFELIVRNLNSLYEIKLKQNEDPEELNDLIGECSLYAMKLIVVAVYNAEQFQYYLTNSPYALAIFSNNFCSS
ncbi:MAG: hypothetical protein WCG42_06245 [Parachlamydiaceae bacterium]